MSSNIRLLDILFVIWTPFFCISVKYVFYLLSLQTRFKIDLHFFLFTGVHDDSLGNKLKVTCGIGSTSVHPTTASVAKTTRSSTEITNPLPFMTTRTTEHQLTTLFNSITVTSTDIPHTKKQTNRQQKDKGI